MFMCATQPNISYKEKNGRRKQTGRAGATTIHILTAPFTSDPHKVSTFHPLPNLLPPTKKRKKAFKWFCVQYHHPAPRIVFDKDDSSDENNDSGNTIATTTNVMMD